MTGLCSGNDNTQSSVITRPDRVVVIQNVIDCDALIAFSQWLEQRHSECFFAELLTKNLIWLHLSQPARKRLIWTSLQNTQCSKPSEKQCFFWQAVTTYYPLVLNLKISYPLSPDKGTQGVWRFFQSILKEVRVRMTFEIGCDALIALWQWHFWLRRFACNGKA